MIKISSSYLNLNNTNLKINFEVYCKSQSKWEIHGQFFKLECYICRDNGYSRNEDIFTFHRCPLRFLLIFWIFIYILLFIFLPQVTVIPNYPTKRAWRNSWGQNWIVFSAIANLITGTVLCIIFNHTVKRGRTSAKFAEIVSLPPVPWR